MILSTAVRLENSTHGYLRYCQIIHAFVPQVGFHPIYKFTRLRDVLIHPWAASAR